MDFIGRVVMLIGVVIMMGSAGAGLEELHVMTILGIAAFGFIVILLGDRIVVWSGGDSFFSLWD